MRLDIGGLAVVGAVLFGGTFGLTALVVTLYAALDGAVGGAIPAWVYDTATRSARG